MTENEAIEELKQNVEMPFGSDISKEASKLAIKALEEIQQYQAIGTVKELSDIGTIKELSDMMQTYFSALSDWREYRKIGTVGEIREILRNISKGKDDVDENGISTGLMHVLKEYDRYTKLGTVEECWDAIETASEHVEAVKLLTLAAICYVENLGIIKDRMKENREARDLYMRMSVVQHSRNSAALERLAGSGIDVDGIRDLEEISRILFPV